MVSESGRTSSALKNLTNRTSQRGHGPVRSEAGAKITASYSNIFEKFNQRADAKNTSHAIWTIL
jgi:hypothetical protein